ncbi:3-hydroxybutyryl-CoA dehydrogenase [Streptomyces albiflavescens]|uniref:3-hydroxybutyryl-CoA dehydrogenase n=1 Tax=Streptomyces albiflavescens TaxID=1623582 RepID=A0A917YDX1_9ACTN|nr:3-hydroxyacyl-CoA dehydrogenase family protein [Streptomyces albiflavescens]GGN92751.1 3-hydroxybutyryl-CoA dehydrogenase [Streptomyces albiflavescens]
MSARHGTVGVVGLGTIGAAVAGRAAVAGHSVLVLDSAERAGERLRQLLDRTPEAHGRIRLVRRIEELAPAVTVLEAVPERRDTKVEVLRALDRACPPETVLASSAAALSLTDLAAASGRPGRLVGLHLPLPTAGLAEIGRTVMTEESAVEQARDLAEAVGLGHVTVGDRAGLISTALLFGFLNQAVTMYDQRLAGRDDIDAAMRHGCGLPLGPLELLDLIGTDTACDILDVLAARWAEPTLQPARRLRHMALAGLLGRKSGRGFYDYRESDGTRPAVERPSPAQLAFRTVGIVGTGTMATGIAEVFAKGGVPTVLVGRTDERAKAAWEAVAASTARAVRRGKLAEAERDAALERLTPSGDLAQLADCDLVIEAIAEDLDVKKRLFRTLGELCRPGALLATTTSSLPVIECGLASGRPEDVIGLHFFNPAPLMRLVEVIPSLETAPQHVHVARELCLRLGKHPVQCMDRPGFIVNALLFPYLNGAVRLTESHYATADEIDDVMKLGCGYPLGPFELLDIIGLDISLSIQRVLHDADRHPRTVPAPLLGHLVAAGRAGRKSGAGFRVYG